MPCYSVLFCHGRGLSKANLPFKEYYSAYTLWRIWLLLVNGSVNTFPRLRCQQQKKAWKPEWSVVRRRVGKQDTWHCLNFWRHIHDNDLLKHGCHRYLKWNLWKRWFLYGSLEAIKREQFARRERKGGLASHSDAPSPGGNVRSPRQSPIVSCYTWL
jgi:hypothetical protein